MKGERCIDWDDALTAEEYNLLREAVGWLPLSLRQAERGLAHTTFLAVPRIAGRTVGMGRALFDYGYTAYLGDIIVLPEYQGRGLGYGIMRSLMNQVEAAADPGDRVMFVLTAAKDREGFYEKLGFERRPTEQYGAGMVRDIRAGETE